MIKEEASPADMREIRMFSMMIEKFFEEMTGMTLMRLRVKLSTFSRIELTNVLADDFLGGSTANSNHTVGVRI
jgi:hypothetical protein